MTHPEPSTPKRTAPTSGSSASGKRRGGKGTPAGSRGPRVDKSAPLHQARVLAMQSLFEDDLTEHDLNSVLQEMGNQVLGEHRVYFARISDETRKAMDELTFLARNTISDESLTLRQFADARRRLFTGLYKDPDTSERDLTEDTLALVRKRTEDRLSAILNDFGDEAVAYIESIRASGASTTNDDDEDSEPDNSLRDFEIRANNRIRDAITNDEQQSRKTLMDIMAHTQRLSRGVREHQAEIDPHIERAAPAFPMHQLAPIDRAVIRIATYELLFEPNVPYKAAINEAVEIAKRFGGPSSGKFSNGVLRTISERIIAAKAEPPQGA